MTAEKQDSDSHASQRREMTGAEMVVQALIDQGVTDIFGYPGGAVLPIYDELFQQDKINHILVRHEQGAGHAAEGYARSTGKVGVMLVTSGPWRHECGNAASGCIDGFHPAGVHQWAGPDESDWLGCVSRNAIPSASRALAPSTIGW